MIHHHTQWQLHFLWKCLHPFVFRRRSYKWTREFFFHFVYNSWRNLWLASFFFIVHPENTSHLSLTRLWVRLCDYRHPHVLWGTTGRWDILNWVVLCSWSTNWVLKSAGGTVYQLLCANLIDLYPASLKKSALLCWAWGHVLNLYSFTFVLACCIFTCHKYRGTWKILKKQKSHRRKCSSGPVRNDIRSIYLVGHNGQKCHAV